MNNSCLSFLENAGIVNDYYQNLVKLIKRVLDSNPSLRINITLDNSNSFNNNNLTLSINVNYEHTLVKRGGRDVPHETPCGRIKDENNENYLVRIDNFDYLNSSDIIIDYSNPNIQNVKSCVDYESFSKKHICIYAAMCSPYFLKADRSITTLTTFINTEEPRRKQLLTKLTTEDFNHINVNDCFKENTLEQLYKKTKLLVNIHQTPHHHTFEELRVLPALECGVIVISEKSPLTETIPYKDLVIWVSYDQIIETITDVLANYEAVHDRIFSEENKSTLSKLRTTNYDTLEYIILEKQT